MNLGVPEGLGVVPGVAYQDEYEPLEMEIVVEEPKGTLEKQLDQGNIVDNLENPDECAQKTLDLYHKACQSMEKWQKKYDRALNLAKLQAMAGDHEIDSKDFPFEGASIAMLPYVLEAMLDFSGRAAPELVWAKEIVSCKLYGEQTAEKEARGERVADYMNYQLTEGIPNWRDDQDKALMALPCVGTCYKMPSFDYDKKRVKSDLYLADEIKFDMACKSFEDAPDKFIERKYSKNEVLAYVRGEQGWQLDEEDLSEDQDYFEFIEAYTWVDLDDDGIKEPYIAIIWKEQEKVVALYPYYDEDTINYNDSGDVICIETLDSIKQYKFLPDPEGGPMGMGWGILLGPMFESINTNLRQLIDAGTLSNTASNSGLIAMDTTSGMGNSVQSGPIEVQLGQLTPVPVRGGQSLSQNVVQFPFAGPNPTLFQLMEYLIQSARQMANAAINVEANAGEAATLYLARLQQGLKVPNSITMRVYNAAQKEFNKIIDEI